MFLKNDHKLGVENGRTGQILGIATDGTMTVQTADRNILTFNTKEYGFLDYAYSRTSYVQGTEADIVLYNADARHPLTYNSFYVASTRARLDLQVFTNDKERFLSQVQIKESKTSTLDYVLPPPHNTQGLGLDLKI